MFSWWSDPCLMRVRVEALVRNFCGECCSVLELEENSPLLPAELAVVLNYPVALWLPSWPVCCCWLNLSLLSPQQWSCPSNSKESRKRERERRGGRVFRCMPVPFPEILWTIAALSSTSFSTYLREWKGPRRSYTVGWLQAGMISYGVQSCT